MRQDKKTVSLIFLAASFIVWLLFREIVASLWVAFRIPTPEGWLIAPSDIVAVGIAVVVFIILLKTKVILEFTKDVVVELLKVVWPNKKETVLSTGVVSILVAFCALVLFFLDTAWGALVKIFYQ